MPPFDVGARTMGGLDGFRPLANRPVGSIGFPEGHATLFETAEGMTIEQVIATTEAELAIPCELVETSGARINSVSISVPSMGEPV
jgi:hypothetical protein